MSHKKAVTMGNSLMEGVSLTQMDVEHSRGKKPRHANLIMDDSHGDLRTAIDWADNVLVAMLLFDQRERDVPRVEEVKRASLPRVRLGSTCLLEPGHE